MGEEQYKFGDAPGLPAVEHRKKAVKEKKKSAAPTKTFYTLVGSKKIVILTVKPNGCYRSYFGNVEKLGADVFQVQRKKWVQSGQWIEPYEIAEKVTKVIEQLQAQR